MSSEQGAFVEGHGACERIGTLESFDAQEIGIDPAGHRVRLYNNSKNFCNPTQKVPLTAAKSAHNVKHGGGMMSKTS